MYTLVLILVAVALAQAKKGPCFDFPGGTFLEFRPSNLNISHSVHYSLQFQTRESEGILMYSEGPDDYEALFLSQGKLVYLLTNPSPSGVEGTSGGLYISDHEVNNGTWLTVELWRNWPEVAAMGRVQSSDTQRLKTGIKIYGRAKNSGETHTDNLNHRGVLLYPYVYIGGIKSTLVHTQGSTPPQFVGRIRQIHEERNSVDFDGYSLNFGEMVKPCR